MRPVKTGGGWPAFFYTLRKMRQAGPWRLWKAIRPKNACKIRGPGMGGQKGGVGKELGLLREVCENSLQAMVSGREGGALAMSYTTYSWLKVRWLAPREMEPAGRLARPMIYSQDVQ